MIKLVLPFPPSVNHYWKACGHRRFISKAGVAFRERVAEAVAENGVKLEGRLFIFVHLFPPDRRRRDIDNCMKALFDALCHAGCFDDDEQIDRMSVMRKEIIKGGQCRVVIGQLLQPGLS